MDWSVAVRDTGTGTDDGVRADVGIITLESRELAYAALCNYDDSAVNDVDALDIMHRTGRATITGQVPPGTVG